MNRLTSGTDPNCECSRCTAECVNEWDGLCWVRLAIKRLAAYEDTGLTPDEIAALRAESERLQSELYRVSRMTDEQFRGWVFDYVTGRAALEGGQHVEP